VIVNMHERTTIKIPRIVRKLAYEGGKGLALRPGCLYSPQNIPDTHFC
jgi:hypothetical protein